MTSVSIVLFEQFSLDFELTNEYILFCPFIIIYIQTVNPSYQRTTLILVHTQRENEIPWKQ